MRQITFQKVLQTDTVPFAELGDRAQTPDGRLWVYVKANEALVLHNALTRTANSDQDTLSSSTDGDGDEIFITQSGASFTAGEFEKAYGLIDAGTGSGQFFKIRTNNATQLTLFKDYALTTSLAVADSDAVIARPHLAEKTAITTLHQVPVGIAQVAFSANEYGWALERGMGAVLAGTALTANELTTPGDDTEGTLTNIGTDESMEDVSTFGRCVVANGTADESAMIDVNLL